ncbi:hypothetical protein Egran_01566 [Elaphomyces granulatus]|uniref:non-specific serine/threonine protein kinase n=1 Tax=Elaphomyces granulatus TaxID=519963 RepID=A0A232M2S9_9EURO|nr:hypothetical protein Egran_01566 [Elaphomyces granulatus]
MVPQESSPSIDEVAIYDKQAAATDSSNNSVSCIEDSIMSSPSGGRQDDTISEICFQPRHRDYSGLDSVSDDMTPTQGREAKAAVGKKWSWFSRHKWQNNSPNRRVTQTKDTVLIHHKLATVVVHESQPVEAPPSNRGGEKEASRESRWNGFFNKLFRKRRTVKREITEQDEAESVVAAPTSTPASETSVTDHKNWLQRFFRVKSATRTIALNANMVKGRWETYRILYEWKRYGMDVHLNQEKGIIYGHVGDVNSLRLRPVEFTAEFYTILEHANLSIVRFQRQKGAASSFHKVVDTLQMMLGKRGLTA